MPNTFEMIETFWMVNHRNHMELFRWVYIYNYSQSSNDSAGFVSVYSRERQHNNDDIVWSHWKSVCWYVLIHIQLYYKLLPFAITHLRSKNSYTIKANGMFLMCFWIIALFIQMDL